MSQQAQDVGKWRFRRPVRDQMLTAPLAQKAMAAHAVEKVEHHYIAFDLYSQTNRTSHRRSRNR